MEQVGFNDIKKIPDNFSIEVNIVIQEFKKIIGEMNVTGKKVLELNDELIYFPKK